MTKSKPTNESYFIRTVYGLQPYYITVKAKDGKQITVDVYGTAYQVVTKTLSRAVTNRAIELYDGRVGASIHQITDLLQTAATALLMGYTDKKAVYHKGYITDAVTDYTVLIGTAYTAVNAYLYAKGVIGDNIGKEIITDDVYSDIIHNVVNIFGYITVGKASVNAVKYNRFIDDVRKNLSTKQLSVFDCIIDNDYINSDGTFQCDLIGIKLEKSKQAVNNIIQRIKKTCYDVISNYNMTVTDFVKYLQTA